jgi:hypothetical protein
MTAGESLHEVERWIDGVTGPSWLWHVKYLSANDTYAKSNVHQAGPYLSKPLLAAAFHRLSERSRSERNPDLNLPAAIDSHGWSGDVRAVWYNSKLLERRSNGRDEARLTGWGGRQNPIVEPNATGALVVFAFDRLDGADPQALRIWICRSAEEADRILDVVGDLEPGGGVLWSISGGDHPISAHRGSCRLASAEVPPPWLEVFPSGGEIVEWVLANRDPWRHSDPDRRLLRRRDCEFDVFKSVEREHVLPRIRRGFESVEEFLEFSHGVSNRRKSRAGRSLELQVRAIFLEEEVPFSWAPRTEGARRPDFIFPSIEHYLDPIWPTASLFMLAAKTTCKDRWRQILNEAARVERKHLLTLQEGVSVPQMQEMKEEGVQLVVPRELVPAYPVEIRDQLVTLQDFLTAVRTSQPA